MKCETFNDSMHGTTTQIGHAIDKWLKKNPNIKIVFVCQSLTGGTAWITIWYEDVESKM